MPQLVRFDDIQKVNIVCLRRTILRRNIALFFCNCHIERIVTKILMKTKKNKSSIYVIILLFFSMFYEFIEELIIKNRRKYE